MPPSQFAELVFEGLKADNFYIFSDTRNMEDIKRRMNDIVHQRNRIRPKSP